MRRVYRGWLCDEKQNYEKRCAEGTNNYWKLIGFPSERRLTDRVRAVKFLPRSRQEYHPFRNRRGLWSPLIWTSVLLCSRLNALGTA